MSKWSCCSTAVQSNTVYTHLCIHVYMYTHTHTHTHIYIYLFILNTCAYIYTCIHTHTHTHTHARIHIFPSYLHTRNARCRHDSVVTVQDTATHLYFNPPHREYICAYIHTCIYTHTYTYTYTYAFVHTRNARCRQHNAARAQHSVARLHYDQTQPAPRTCPQGADRSRPCCARLCACRWCRTEVAAAGARLYVQHTATHYNTLQHAATRCNALQHAATHCNTFIFDLYMCLWLIHMCLVNMMWLIRIWLAYVLWLIHTCLVHMMWLVHMCDMTHLNACAPGDSGTWHCCVWLCARRWCCTAVAAAGTERYAYTYSHSCMWYDSSMFVLSDFVVPQLLVQARESMCHDSFNIWLVYVMWLIHVCDMTDSHVRGTHVPWLIQCITRLCHVTPPYMWHHWFTCVGKLCAITQSMFDWFMWCDSLMDVA